MAHGVVNNQHLMGHTGDTGFDQVRDCLGRKAAASVFCLENSMYNRRKSWWAAVHRAEGVERD